MDRLINAILKLSREGRRRLTPERIDLAGAHRGRRGGDPPPARCRRRNLIAIEDVCRRDVSDRLALEQMFGNLIDNAVKYLDPARPGLNRRARRAGRAAGSSVEIEDNGRGIGAQDHERIFELFRRSGAQERPARASGLRMCERWSGASAVRSRSQSELGRGTTFQVSLPGYLEDRVRPWP